MEDKLSKYLETKYSFKLDESDIKMLDEDAPNLVSELVNWSVPDGDVIHVPDELDPLINSVSMQIGFLMHSQKSLNKTICDIVWRAHEINRVYERKKISYRPPIVYSTEGMLPPALYFMLGFSLSKVVFVPSAILIWFGLKTTTSSPLSFCIIPS